MSQWLQLTNRQQGAFTAIFFAGTSLALGLYYATLHLAPSRAMSLYLKSYETFVVLWVWSFCWVSRKNLRLGIQPDFVAEDARRGNLAGLRVWWSARQTRIDFLSIFIIAMGFVGPSRTGWNIAWSVGLATLVQVLSRLQGWILGLSQQGHYDWALWMNRLSSWIPGHGGLNEGWILLDAGRYPEAEAFFTPLAFDESGRPRLSRIELYYYATALLDEDKYSKAQELFEAAVRESQEHWYFHYGLADCLLSQNREPDRARELIGHVLTNSCQQLTVYQQRAMRAQCIALHAWALASGGMRDEAETKLKEAYSVSTGLNKHDFAALTHLKGVTREAIGDLEGARSAF